MEEGKAGSISSEECQLSGNPQDDGVLVLPADPEVFGQILLNLAALRQCPWDW